MTLMRGGIRIVPGRTDQPERPKRLSANCGSRNEK